MKTTNIIYWIATILVCALMLFSGIGGLFGGPESVKFITDLGYPAYFIPFISAAKILGVIAVLIPGFPRLKEWAYAGLTFDLLGANYSLIEKGYTVKDWAMIPLSIIILFVSYFMYQKRQARKLAAK